MRDTIVIGASAGGVGTLGRLVEQFPSDIPASILVAVHMSASSVSVLADILSRRTKLSVSAPRAAERLAPHHLYVVSPGYHLVVHDAEARSTRGVRVNGQRPSIDVLFRSAARARGERVVGVVLTGMLDDGVSGLLEIRTRGGVCVVQKPEDALYPMLPINAIAGAGADYVVPVSEMGRLLVALVSDRSRGGGASRGESGSGASGGGGGDMTSRKAGPAQDWSPSAEVSPEGGHPSVYTCPECHGVLAKTGPDDLPRFVCRVGHAYDPETLLAESGTAAEQAMWAAVRASEEWLSLARKLRSRAEAIGDGAREEQLGRDLERTEQQVQLLRRAVEYDG